MCIVDTVKLSVVDSPCPENRCICSGSLSCFSDTDNSDAARKRREREEKKLQRQKEMQEKREARKTGGALKLGAKRLNQA